MAHSLPKQAKFIIGTEACERFSFYGMKSILMLYMTTELLMHSDYATSILHLFVAMVYLLPLVGAWLADKVLGRYKTILYISLLYCVGHGVLALGDLFHDLESRQWVLMTGLFIIAVGAGGIKPCVSSFMGDQIESNDSALMTKAFNAFYWSINLGSFFSFICIPAIRNTYGYSWAFAIPGIFMGVATFIFWLGRKRYHIAPTTDHKRAGFWSVMYSVLFKGGWASTEKKFGEESITDAKHILKVLSIFAFVIPFWSVFDQTASSWVTQGNMMQAITIPLFGDSTWVIGPETIQAANPVLIMVLIPLISVFVYPYVTKLASPLVRIGVGLFTAALSFVIVAMIQSAIEDGAQLSIAWQLLPYLVLTISEILLSTTGLEFAYTQAPTHLKSMITSFWNLTIFMGNILVALITYFLASDDGSNAISTERFYLYAGIVGVVAVLYAIRARHYNKEA